LCAGPGYGWDFRKNIWKKHHDCPFGYGMGFSVALESAWMACSMGLVYQSSEMGKQLCASGKTGQAISIVPDTSLTPYEMLGWIT
jgi:hypothetical protein